ncbi:MAG TPA: hypothetical protein PLS46_01535 [Microthrixaceae bacterium]|jgi:hypothetical protein|nr:hypothetical protein [Microthrixaceae bacterium]
MTSNSEVFESAVGRLATAFGHEREHVLADEHARYRLYLEAYRQSPDLRKSAVDAIAMEPDRAMQQSTVGLLLDEAATRSASDRDLARWWATWPETIRRIDYLRRREAEWEVVLRLACGGDLNLSEVSESSDWLQRKLAAQGRRDVAEFLSENGRTRRIRNLASARLTGDL